MAHKRNLALFFFFFFLGTLLVPAAPQVALGGAAPSAPVKAKPAEAAPTQGPASSGADDRVGLGLTVYNGGLALVRDIRSVDLKKGRSGLVIEDIAKSIIPGSILIRPAEGKKKGFDVIEQEYEYDEPTGAALLERFVGKKIRVEIRNSFNDRVQSMEATLLGLSPEPVYLVGKEVYIGLDGVRVLPALPEGLATRPRIKLIYEARRGGARRLETTYLVRHMGWGALYQLVLRGETGRAWFSGRVSLVNESGMDFRDADIRLVAGSPHLLERQGPAVQPFGEARSSLAALASAPQEAPLFEYHEYEIGRKVDLEDKGRKELGLLKTRSIRLEKEYELRGRSGFFTAPLRSPLAPQPVRAYLSFRNSASNHLGLPLPAGKVRIYVEGPDGGLEFIGEDRLGHTPTGDMVRLEAGRVFDVRGYRVQTSYNRVSSVLYDTEWEIRLKNSKEEDVSVNLVEPLAGSWEILDASHAYEKVDAFTIRFRVAVPAGGEVTVRYRVRVEL